MSKLEAFWNGAFESSVPLRYRGLIREVAEALPEGWDDHADWTVEVALDQHPQGYARVSADEEAAGEMVMSYVVTLYPALLDRLSDRACQWVFAHEFAHIASKLRFGSIVIGNKAYTKIHNNEYKEAPAKNEQEDAANQIALKWGFGSALQALIEEDERMNSNKSAQ